MVAFSWIVVSALAAGVGLSAYFLPRLRRSGQLAVLRRSGGRVAIAATAAGTLVVPLSKARAPQTREAFAHAVERDLEGRGPRLALPAAERERPAPEAGARDPRSTAAVVADSLASAGYEVDLVAPEELPEEARERPGFVVPPEAPRSVEGDFRVVARSDDGTSWVRSLDEDPAGLLRLEGKVDLLTGRMDRILRLRGALRDDALVVQGLRLRPVRVLRARTVASGTNPGEAGGARGGAQKLVLPLNSFWATGRSLPGAPGLARVLLERGPRRPGFLELPLVNVEAGRLKSEADRSADREALRAFLGARRPGSAFRRLYYGRRHGL